MFKSLRKLRSSLAFRLGVYHSLSGLIIILVLLGFIYLQIMGALHGTHFRQVSSVSKRVTNVYEARGRQGLIDFIDNEIDLSLLNSPELFFMKDKSGKKITGNIDFIPNDFLNDDYLSEVRILQNGQYIYARLRKLNFADDVVYVGRNLDELASFRSLIGRTSFVTVVVALALSWLSTYWFLFELKSGAYSIRQTAMKIRAGRFKERIPVRGQDDEISLLSKELNLMLDHMEASLNGVKYVSDTIAHNLRTPLMRILVRLRPLERPGIPQEEVQEGVSKALEEVETLKRLFEKLLYISEMESGLQRRTFKSVNLTELIVNILDLYGVLAEEAGIKFHVSLAENLEVIGDSDLLASALSNLLENALKYAKTDIFITTGVLDGKAYVELLDDGGGVSESSLAKLGQYFYRAPSSEPSAGIGLGLTSVLAVMKQHQGSCEFKNKHKGLGVRLLFPLTRENH